MVTADPVRRAAAILGRAAARAHRDGIGRRASALAYATLVSLVPLLAVISIFVAQALREDDGQTLRLIAQLLPYREESVVEALRSFVAQAESVSGLALAGFLVTSLATFFSVQETLFSIFGVSAPPALGRRIVTFTLLAFWGPVLIGSAYAGLLYLSQSGALRESTLLRVLPMVVTFVGLAMLYWRAAVGRIRFRHAAAGSAIATVLIELLKSGFELYVSSFTAVQRAVYGTFAIVLFFVLSVQLAWWILLYGAEVAASAGGAAPRAGGDGLRPDPWIALAALERLAGPRRPAATSEELADVAGIAPAAIRRHLEPLTTRGLLEAPLSPSGQWRLALAPGRIRLDAIFAAYEPLRPEPDPDRPEPALERLRQRLAGARAEALAGATLDDWLTRGAPDATPEEGEAFATGRVTVEPGTPDESTRPGLTAESAPAEPAGPRDRRA
jgi:membrane protein